VLLLLLLCRCFVWAAAGVMAAVRYYARESCFKAFFYLYICVYLYFINRKKAYIPLIYYI
jgi:hypothetical protein